MVDRIKNSLKNRWIRYFTIFLLTLGGLVLMPQVQSRVIAKGVAPSAATAFCAKVDACLNQARDNFEMNNDKQARDILEALLRPPFGPSLSATKRSQVLATLGDIYTKRGDLDLATQTLTESLKQAQTPADQSAAHYGLALVESARREAESPRDLFDLGQFPISAWPTFYEEKLRQPTLAGLRQFDASIAPLQGPTVYDSGFPAPGQPRPAIAQVEVLQAKLGQLRLIITQIPKFYLPWSSNGYTDEVNAELSLKFNPQEGDTLAGFKTDLKAKIEKLQQLKQATFEQFQPDIESVNRALVAELPAIRDAFQTLAPGSQPASLQRETAKALIEARLYFAETLRRLPDLLAKEHEVNRQYYELAAKLDKARAALTHLEAQSPTIPATTIKAPVNGNKNAKPSDQPGIKIGTESRDWTILTLLSPPLQAELNDLVASSYNEAVKQLAAALQTAQQNQLPNLENQARINLIKLYAATDQWSAVEQLLSPEILQAADLAGTPELSGPLYGYDARVLKNKGAAFYAEALTASDLAIARIEAVRSDLLSLAPGVQYNYRNDVEAFYRDNLELRLLNLPTATEPRQKELDLVRKRVESLQLAEIHNYFREPCIQGKTVSLDQTIDQKSPTTAVIYPIMLPDKLAILVRLPNQKDLQYYTVDDLSQAKLEATATAWKSQLEGVANAGEPTANGRQLYQWLIAPYIKELNQQPAMTLSKQLPNKQLPDKQLPSQPRAKIDTLVFVLDGALRNIPMAALIDANGKFLIQTKAIAVSPGLQLFDPNPIRSKDLYVFAAGLKGPSAYGELKFVQKELKQIADTRIRYRELPEGKQFNPTNLQQEIQSAPFSVVHLSTHGNFSDKLEDTYLLGQPEPQTATSGQPNRPTDGKIFMDRLQAMLQSRDLTREEAIELLVLSACETATSDRAALGIAGLTLKTGVRSTLATLWKVYDDEAMPIFFGKFYSELKQGSTRAKALQAAQNDLLTNRQYPEKYKNPVSWAAFSLLGSWM